MKQVSLKIDLDIKQLKSLVRQLSPQDKLKLNDAIWEGNTFSIPEEHQKLVLQRKAKSKTDPKRMLDWDEASKSLKL